MHFVSGAAEPLIVCVGVLTVLVRIIGKEKWTSNPLRLLIEIHGNPSKIGGTPVDGDPQHIEVLEVRFHLTEKRRLIISVDVGNDTSLTHAGNGDIGLKFSETYRDILPTRNCNGLPL